MGINSSGERVDLFAPLALLATGVRWGRLSVTVAHALDRTWDEGERTEPPQARALYLSRSRADRALHWTSIFTTRFPSFFFFKQKHRQLSKESLTWAQHTELLSDWQFWWISDPRGQMFQFKFHKTKKEKPKSDKDKASSQNSAQFCKLHAVGERKPSRKTN